MLILGDLIAIRTYRAHVQWPYIIRLHPPALVGIAIGYFWIRNLKKGSFKDSAVAAHAIGQPSAREVLTATL